MGVLEEFIGNAFYYTIDAPVTFVRDFVDSQRKRSPYYYYHQRFPRVPSIEECAVDDYVCMYEGNMQYKRDRLVDMEILKHLQKVLADCNLMEGPNAKQSCKAQLAEYEEAADGYQGKCKYNPHIHAHHAKTLVLPSSFTLLTLHFFLSTVGVVKVPSTLVDMEILKHLQKVLADCNLMEGPNAKQSCKAQLAEYEEAADGYQGKYGELGGTGNAVKCMMKQKARLMEERRKAREQGKA
eukprot:XP_011667428.1 PREDICTED: NADH dehydrogenase [ubiquinone] 1 beta subcomplex subunit 10 [Strongylocentrotus purpuratus]